jgi:hypothetical protein
MKMTIFKLRYHVVFENGIRGAQTTTNVAAETAQQAEELLQVEAMQENVKEVQVLSAEVVFEGDVLSKSGDEVKHDLTEEALKVEYDKGYSSGYADGVKDENQRLTSDRNVTSDTPTPVNAPPAVANDGGDQDTAAAAAAADQ